MAALSTLLRDHLSLDSLRATFDSLFGDRLLQQNGMDLPPTSVSVASLLPYRTYDDKDELFYNANSYGFLLEISPLVGADAAAVNLLTGMLTEALPAHCSVQLLTYGSPKIGDLLNFWYEPRHKVGGLYQTIGKRRAEMFSSGAWHRLLPFEPFLLREFRCFVAVALPGTATERDVERLRSVRLSMEAALRAINVASVRLGPEALLTLLDEWVNPTTDIYQRSASYDPYVPLNLQLANPETQWGIFPSYLSTATTRARPDHSSIREEFRILALSARKFPKYWAQWQNQKLIGDDESGQLKFSCPFVQHFTFTTTDETNAASRAALKAARATQQADDYQLAKYIPSIKEKKLDWNFVAEKLKQGQKLVDSFYGLTLFAPAGQEVEAERLARGVYQTAGWRLAKEYFVQLQTMLVMLPFTPAEGLAKDLKSMARTRTMVSWSCANLAPIQGEYRGNMSPGLLLLGRRGQPLLFDPFANQEGNYNVAVVGKSGSGKSVLMQEIVTAARGEGARVIVLDDGRSFENSAKMQGAAYVEFTHKSRLCVNMFSMIDEEAAARDRDYLTEGLNMIVSVVCQMARETGKIDDYEKGLISRAVMRAWEAKRVTADVATVAAILKEEADPRAQDLVVMLSPYIEGGIFYDFFNGRCNVKLDEGLTVFELAELKNKKALQGVVVLILMFLASEAMYRGKRQRKTYIVADEAWDLLRGEQSGDLIEGVARRCRKYRGSLVTGTQSVNDYYRTPGALAAFENSDWVLFLAQKPESIEALKQNGRIKVTEHMERDLRSLRMVDAQYSEIMIYGPPGHHIGRLILDTFSAALYSSKGEDFVRVQALLEQGRSLQDAVTTVAEDIERRRKAA